MLLLSRNFLGGFFLLSFFPCHPFFLSSFSQQPHAPQGSSHVSSRGDKARRPRATPAPPPAWEAAETTELSGSEPATSHEMLRRRFRTPARSRRPPGIPRRRAQTRIGVGGKLGEERGKRSEEVA
jgi:hypothetical protein